ncbi:MAG TPA: Uma2 family endonuclease [Lichenihabitans sp.]|jgi:Uma2 family endonuclease|nr:Uma2 family endonuclease [Lichenihabitans sp.]
MSDVRAERWPTTADQFLAWPGDGRAKRYELVDGEICGMSPASAFHGIIQLTLGSMIRQTLRDTGSPCTALTEPAVKPGLHSEFNLRVPDLGVTCSSIMAGQILIEDPILLVEILSPSNRARTWMNVWAYTTIPSVREIIIVHSDKIEVQILCPSTDRVWPDNPEQILAGGTLRLDSIGFVCPVEEIYADTPLG